MMSGECTWRVHPGNIPTLYQTCLSAVQNHDRIMDAILLQGEMIGFHPRSLVIFSENPTQEASKEMNVVTGKVMQTKTWNFIRGT